MKIIFLNTWHSTMRDELLKFVQSRLDSTDVFCFQEAREEDRELYAEVLARDFVLHSTQRLNEVTDSDYGNAMYIRKSISIVEKGAIFEDEIGARDIGLANYVTLDINGEKVTVCNVHGVPLPSHKRDTPTRLYQSQTLLDSFKSRNQVIVGGDFNLFPDTQSIQLFSQAGYQDLIDEFEIETTRNRITFEKFPDNIQLFADYAFVSPSIKVRSFVVPSDVVSDHQPLELEVEVRVLTEALLEADTAEVMS